MHHFAQGSLSLILLLAAAATSNAFLAPGGRRNPLAQFSSHVGSSLDRRAVPLHPSLHQSVGDTEGGDGPNTINVALITTAVAEGDGDLQNEALQTAVDDHPFCQMTGVRLAVASVPALPSPAAPWDDEHVSRLRDADVACFGTAAAVTSYLQKLDRDHWDVAEDVSEEDRRGLPNRPDPVGDVAVMMAACPSVNAARECLNSGRWESNHIYYPKDTQGGAVELKTEPLRGGDGDEGGEEEEEEDIDVKVWAASVVQAASDAMERKFWGGGW